MILISRKPFHADRLKLTRQMQSVKALEEILLKQYHSKGLISTFERYR